MTEDRASALLRLVGGPANVERVWHCMSRLRFALVDDSLADDEALRARDEVVAVVRRSPSEYHVAVRRDLLVIHGEVQALLSEKNADEVG